MIVRSVRFDDELYYKLVDASAERNVSFQWLVHKLCEEGLERLAPEMKVTS